MTSEKAMKKTKWNINHVMLPFKIHYFMYFGAAGGILPYIVVFIKERLGITSTALGVMCTTQQFVVVLTKPCIGIIVDKTNRMKHVIIVLVVIKVVCFMSLLTIPKLDRNPPIATKTTSWTLNMKNLDFPNPTIPVSCLTSAGPSSQHPNLNDTSWYEITPTAVSNRSGTVSFCPMLQRTEHDTDIAGHYNSTTTCITMVKNNFVDSNIVGNIACFPNTSTELYKDIGDILAKNSTCYLHWNNGSTSGNSITITQASMLCQWVTTGEVKSVFLTYNYWVFYFVLLLGGICVNALFTLSDTACYESLHKTGSDYGKQRVFGALSWGIVAPLAGYFNDVATGTSETSDYSPGWYMMAIFSLFVILNIARLDLVNPNQSHNFWKDVGSILSSLDFIVFDVGVFFIGFFTGYIWFYLPVFLQGIGSSRLQMGLIQTSQCLLGEIPFMYFSGWFLNKLGHFHVLSSVFLTFALRFACYSVLYDAWYVFPIEVTHGLTYGIFYPALTAFAKLSAKPGTEATTQSILCCTYEGLGAGLGGIVAGIGFDRIGSHKTFLYSSIVCLVLSVSQFTAAVFLKRRLRSSKNCES